MAWSGAASHRLATDPLSSPGLHRALCNEKAAVHARFVGGQVQRVNMGSSSFKRHSHRRRDRCNACLPHHCAPSVRRASSRIEGVLGRAMNAVDLLARGRAGLGRADLAASFDDFVHLGGHARARGGNGLWPQPQAAKVTRGAVGCARQDDFNAGGAPWPASAISPFSRKTWIDW